MLSLAYSVGMFINLIIFWLSFKKDFKYKKGIYGVRKSFTQSMTASFIIGIVSYIMLNLTNTFFNQDATFGVLAHGFVSGIIGILVGGIFLTYVKNRETEVFLKAIKQKFFKKKIFGKIHTNI
jgi:multisubunit Na+/H+ antiporter MnhE subunit